MTWSAVEVVRQNTPLGIGFIYQLYFPGAEPVLQTTFALASTLSAFMDFVLDQPIQVMLLREAGHSAGLVGFHATHKVIRMPDIERAVLAVGHDVRIERHTRWHRE